MSAVARSPRRRRGSVRVSELQRARMLSSAAAVVSEHGYGQMSVARVTGRARVSRRTFYDVFSDREDCFLAVFDEALERLASVVVEAYEGGGRVWRERVRAGLGALLVFFDECPDVASLLVVDALCAGPRVLRRRMEVLEGVGRVLHEGGLSAKGSREVGELAGEGVVGAVFNVIHGRLLLSGPGPLSGLLNQLMGLVVLQYLGPAAAARELRDTRVLSPGQRESAGSSLDRRGRAGLTGLSLARDPLVDLPMRLTYRTLRVLGAVRERAGASNRVVAEFAGTSDQGQISKLLARLERLGLVENTVVRSRRSGGGPNAWRLTVRGEEIERATRVAVAAEGASASAGAARRRGGAR